MRNFNTYIVSPWLLKQRVELRRLDSNAVVEANPTYTHPDLFREKMIQSVESRIGRELTEDEILRYVGVA